MAPSTQCATSAAGGAPEIASQPGPAKGVSQPGPAKGGHAARYVAAMATCESCGRDEAELTKVQRVYLISDSDSTGLDSAGPAAPLAELEASATPTAGDIELWCASCCATFPHAPVTAD